MCGTHYWARGSSYLTIGAAYLAFLQVSRAALLASAHHLQPPLATRLDSGVTAAAGTVNVAVGAYATLCAVLVSLEFKRFQGYRGPIGH